jgi:hypothetical protein
MNKIMGFFASKCTGLTPSSTPPCGGAFTTAVGAALAIALDMWGGYLGFAVPFPGLLLLNSICGE